MTRHFLKIKAWILGSLKKRRNEEANLENMRLAYNEKYYNDLDEVHEQYDIFIHDIKHTMRTVKALAKESGCVEIEELIGNMQIKIGNIQNRIICSHKILNALLNERKAYADERGAELELDIAEPLYLKDIDDIDLITIIGNLLDNAIEAETHAKEREGVLCRIHMSGNGLHIIIQIENSYNGRAVKRAQPEALRYSNSIGNKHGIGLKSVKEAVEKYGGIFNCEQSDKRYSAKVILPIQANAEKEVFAGNETESTIAY